MLHLKIFFTNPLFLVPTVWVSFGCATAWLFFQQKDFTHYLIMMLNFCGKVIYNLVIVAKKFENIAIKKKIIGYKCQCGYEHKQERPLINFGN
ncbi:MAG: hypothetical protein P8X97_03370 [Candidatus Bathyarchaeota archaeon]